MDDLISRQAVLDLPRIKTHNQWGNVIKESVDVEDVRQLPPVTPAEKVGHWMDNGSCGNYVCSVCKNEFDSDIPNMKGFNFELPKYCPNCGAKMQEVEK